MKRCPWLRDPLQQTHFCLHTVVSACSLVRTQQSRFHELISSWSGYHRTVSSCSVNAAPTNTRKSDRFRSILHLSLPGKHACCIGMRVRELSCVQFRVGCRPLRPAGRTAATAILFSESPPATRQKLVPKKCVKASKDPYRPSTGSSSSVSGSSFCSRSTSSRADQWLEGRPP